jgi:glycosyltransferase involved in cell wall biosynthesis
MRNKIAWITGDYYIDVDLPILPYLIADYDIDWFIVINKSATVNYKPLIESKIDKSKIRIHYLYLNKRVRNPLILFGYFKLIFLLRRASYKLLYFNISGLPYFFPLVTVFLRKRTNIIAIHNVTTPSGAINQNLAEIYVKYLIRNFKNIHVFSDNQKAALLQLSKTKKNILTTPLSMKDFGQPKYTLGKISKITFLFFGYIRDYKRLDILIEAANYVYEERGDLFRIKINGACNNWEKYQKLILYPQIFDLRIESIPNEDIPDLFGQVQYAVFPYQDIAQSGAITVAFNYNVPVIVSDLPSFSEFVIDHETGFLFKSLSVDSLASVMLYILDNHDDIYSFLKDKQKLHIHNTYSSQIISMKYKKYFNTILNSK